MPEIKPLSPEIKKRVLQMQQNELTEYHIYTKVAGFVKNPENKATLLKIANEEHRHYQIWETFTKEKVQPIQWKVWWYTFLSVIFGYTFALKLMEGNEGDAAYNYEDIAAEIPQAQKIAEDEERHEQDLIGMINEERLEYMGSVVLGLNDALVEFTGALAGFTLALGDSRLIALTGSITGIAAALSMASSEYLSTKSDNAPGKHPVKAAVYTGIAYVITVVALVLPFVLIPNALVALAVMLVAALLIITLFNYYYAVARRESFRRRFTEMAVLSFSVAGISFLIGYLLKAVTGIEA